MSDALERVIAEQQKTIDNLKQVVESDNRTFAMMGKQREDAFRHVQRITDFHPGTFVEEAAHTKYHEHRHELRIWLLENGWCIRCHSFMCECNEE